MNNLKREWIKIRGNSTKNGVRMILQYKYTK